MSEHIDLRKADDPRDVVHRAVACLAQGGVVVLPTDTGHALAAIALHPAAVDRIAIGRRDAGSSVALRGAAEVDDWAPGISDVGRRLARRAWPGPVVLSIRGDFDRGLARHLPPTVRGLVTPGGDLGLRSPQHHVAREVLRLVPGPLFLTDLQGPAAGAADADMILDDGQPDPAGEPTIVRVDGESWSIARAGVVGRDDLTRMAGTVLLFVCTGNTCRSPMAEAICKTLIAERLGVPIEGLPERGYVVLSAGVSASDGMPAASHAADVVRARGGSLRGHASRRVTQRLVDEADVIVAMTRDHLDALLDHVPEAADRARLLNVHGLDIEDPIGADRDTYRCTAETIEEHLGYLLDELQIGPGGG